MKNAQQIFEENVGSDQQLDRPITKEDVIKCINEALRLKSGDVLNIIKPLFTDELVNAIRDEYISEWKKANPEYPENDYTSGINDGMYAFRNWMLRDQQG